MAQILKICRNFPMVITRLTANQFPSLYTSFAYNFKDLSNDVKTESIGTELQTCCVNRVDFSHCLVLSSLGQTAVGHDVL